MPHPGARGRSGRRRAPATGARRPECRYGEPVTGRPPLPLTVAVLVALAAVACGGDGDEGDGPRLSAEEFRRQGNAICRAGDADLARAAEGLFGEDGITLPEPQELVRFFTEEALPVARRKLDQLEGLRPPEGDRETVAEMIQSGRDAVDEVEEALREDPEGFLRETGPDPFADFDELATELGLDDCTGDDEE